MSGGTVTKLRAPPDWKKKLARYKSGAPKKILLNGVIGLRESPAWFGKLAFNAFSLTTVLTGAPPWEFNPNDWMERNWTELDDLYATEWFQTEGVDLDIRIVSQAVEAVAQERPFHPVQEYLSDLEWDGVPRLCHWLPTYFGTENTPYYEAIGKAVLIGAVARIFQPGCKLDTIVIIEGAQGSGKSSALRTLFYPWFTDELAEIGTKDAAMQTRGVWCVEIAELDALSGANVSRAKAFISRTIDRYRPPYGRRLVEIPRSCQFWGTTNSESYLKDATGGRRFWPIKSDKIDLTGLTAVRDQLWAEAKRLHDGGHPWYLFTPETKSAATNEQSARFVGDPWEEIITAFVDPLENVSIDEILGRAIRLEPKYWKQPEKNRVARCLRHIGWEKYQHRDGSIRSWRYRKMPGSEQQ